MGLFKNKLKRLCTKMYKVLCTNKQRQRRLHSVNHGWIKASFFFETLLMNS